MTNATNLLTPNGTYIIMNAGTHTYLNVLNFGPPGSHIVCSVGNWRGNDIVSFELPEGHPLMQANSGTI